MHLCMLRGVGKGWLGTMWYDRCPVKCLLCDFFWLMEVIGGAEWGRRQRHG